MEQCLNQAFALHAFEKRESSEPTEGHFQSEFLEAVPRFNLRSESESSGKGSSCSHCRRLIRRLSYDRKNISKVDETFYRQCFHDPCDKCDELSERFAVNLRACTFCRHLRLGHLYRCVLPSLPHEHHDERASIYIHADHYRQGQMFNCDFCKIMSGAFDSMAKPDGEVSIERFTSDILNLLILEGSTIKKRIEVSRTEQRFFNPYDHLGEQVNWRKVRGWETRHNNEYPDLPPGFRVIDVMKNCLVIPHPPFRYLTLSYVWGSPDQGKSQGAEVQATLDKIRSWEKEGSLAVLGLPATIQDAMTSCRNLGYRYLWVDRLCIPQDSPELKHDQISRMDAIYALSQLTIVAAAGEDARHGLEGVSRQRSYRHNILYWEGLEMKPPFPSIQEVMSESKWTTRGWTCQEGICAPNLLFFTEKGVFADFKKYSPVVKKVESHTYSEEGSRVWSRKSRFRTWNYFDCVEDYTKRSLTYLTDILNAFAGITHQLGPDIGRHCKYGLPLKLFDQSMLWEPLNGHGKPRALTTPGIYPSWSWCSIEGPVTYTRLFRRSMICGSVASWAFFSAADSLNVDLLTAVPFVPFPTEPPFGSKENEESKPKKPPALAIAWDKIFLFSKCFNRQPFHSHDRIIIERTARSHRSTREYPTESWEQHAKTPEPLSLAAFSGNDQRKASEKAGRLLVLSQTTWFELEYIGQLRSGHAFLIRSSEGLLSGMIWLTQHVTESHVSAAVAGSQQCMEFLALSITPGVESIAETARQLNLLVRTRPDEMLDIQMKPYVHSEDDQEWKPAKELGFNYSSPPGLNVMLITRHDGVAQRLGIGQIYMDRWKGGNPQFCTTVLE